MFGTGMGFVSISYDLHELLLASSCLKKEGQKVNAELYAVSTKHAGIEVLMLAYLSTYLTSLIDTSLALFQCLFHATQGIFWADMSACRAPRLQG